MALNFKYKSVDRPDGKNVKTPSIPLTIHGKVISYDHIALLDSGADVSAMSKDMADLLNLNLNKKPEKTRGIGGEVEAIQTKMNITIGGGSEIYNLEIPVNVILGGKEFPLLLGRSGFFNHFVIIFDQANQKVTLKNIDSRGKW